jgi:hypothetical protein
MRLPGGAVGENLNLTLPRHKNSPSRSPHPRITPRYSRLKMASITLPAAADFHVHLRDGSMMETVVPTVRQGGVSLAYVMVNPPLFFELHKT